MEIPSKIRIEYVEDYYTDHIGRCANGTQFMGVIVATLGDGPSEGWEARKRWYAVLHLFDAFGTHLETKHWFAGTTADGESTILPRAKAKRNEMVAELGEVTFGDVEVALFSTTIDGHVFGLVDTSDPELGPRITLEPNDFLASPDLSMGRIGLT